MQYSEVFQLGNFQLEWGTSILRLFNPVSFIPRTTFYHFVAENPNSAFPSNQLQLLIQIALTRLTFQNARR